MWQKLRHTEGKVTWIKKRTRQKSKLQLDSAVFESKKNTTNESSSFKKKKKIHLVIKWWFSSFPNELFSTCHFYSSFQSFIHFTITIFTVCLCVCMRALVTSGGFHRKISPSRPDWNDSVHLIRKLKLSLSLIVH